MSTADLVVGADGAWSKLRSLLSNVKPAYRGTCFIEVALLDGAARHRQSIDAIGDGTLMALAQGKGIVMHRYPDGTARGYAALNKPEEWMGSIDLSGARVGLAKLAEQFERFAPHLTRPSPTATPMRHCARSTRCRSAIVGIGCRG